MSVIAAFLPLCCTGQIEQEQPTPKAADALKTFLRSYLDSEEDKTTRYIAAFVDLNGDGVREVIVYIYGQDWCGSGGCTMLILTPSASSYQEIGHRMTVTRPPIRVLSTKSHGWYDISVWVHGGGIQPAYEAELQFNGKQYPSNPSVSPARRLRGNVAGKVVISGSESGIPLYR